MPGDEVPVKGARITAGHFYFAVHHIERIIVRCSKVQIRYPGKMLQVEPGRNSRTPSRIYRCGWL